MSLNSLLDKNHVYKQRRSSTATCLSPLQWGSSGFQVQERHRFELVYLRTFKLVFKRKFLKARTRYFRPSYRIYLHPNFLLTAKSKNSRMGCGVGLLVRAVVLLQKGRIFIECLGYSLLWISRVYTAVRYCYPYKFFLIISSFWYVCDLVLPVRFL